MFLDLEILCIRISVFKSSHEGKYYLDFKVKISGLILVYLYNYNYCIIFIASDSDNPTSYAKNEGNSAKPPSLAEFDHLARLL